VECKICKKNKNITDFEANYNVLMVCKSCKFDFVTCTKCKNLKHVNYFYGDRRRKNGRSCWCKSCINNNKKARKYGHVDTAKHVSIRRSVEFDRDIKSISTDLESYDI